MPFQLRNLRAASLVLSRTRLTLPVNGERRVSELNEEIRRAAEKGYIQIIDLDAPASQPVVPPTKPTAEVAPVPPPVAPPTETAPDDDPFDGIDVGELLDQMEEQEGIAPVQPSQPASRYPNSLEAYNATEAVQYVTMIVQPDLLRTLRQAETRKTVLVAIDKRLAKLEEGGIK